MYTCMNLFICIHVYIYIQILVLKNKKIKKQKSDKKWRMIYGSDYLYFLYFPFQSMFKNDNAYDYKQLVFFRKARIYTET